MSFYLFPSDVAPIQAALCAVEDESFNVRYLYPPLARQLAGQELYREGIVLAFMLAVRDAVRLNDYPIAVEIVLQMSSESYVNALIGIAVEVEETA